MLTVLLIWRCKLTVALSARSGRYFGSSTVTSAAGALPPTPGRYGGDSGGGTVGSGAAKPSGPVRKGALGAAAMWPKHCPVRLHPGDETASSSPVATRGA